MNALKVALVALMFATVAQAQQAQQGQQGQQQPGEQRTGEKPPPIAGGAVLGIEVKQLALVATGYRVSKVLGEPVYSDKNERIGQLEEFIVQPDGALTFAIIEVGGFLGLRAHRVAIPIEQFSEMRPRVTLPGATKEALKKMPEFVYAKGQ